MWLLGFTRLVDALSRRYVNLCNDVVAEREESYAAAKDRSRVLAACVALFGRLSLAP